MMQQSALGLSLAKRKIKGPLTITCPTWRTAGATTAIPYISLLYSSHGIARFLRKADSETK